MSGITIFDNAVSMQDLREKHRQALVALKEETGDTYYRIARRSGLASSTISNMANGKGPPDTTLTTKTIQKIRTAYPQFLQDESAREPLSSFRSAPTNRDLPVLGTAAAADSQTITINNGEPIDYCTRPPGLAGKRDAYALYVVGSSMSPRFEPGDRIYVDGARPPRPGDYAVIQLIDPAEGETITLGMIKRFVRADSDTVVLEQFAPEQMIDLERRRVATMHRVLNFEDLA